MTADIDQSIRDRIDALLAGNAAIEASLAETHQQLLLALERHQRFLDDRPKPPPALRLIDGGAEDGS